MGIIERIKTKPGYKYLAFMLLLLGAYWVMRATDPLTPVYNNTAVLQCTVVNNGIEEVVDINASKHPVLIDEEGVYAWNGGYSHDCTVVKK